MQKKKKKKIKELKEREIKIKKQFKELNKLEEDFQSFKKPKHNYTPNPKNQRQKDKKNLCQKNLKD